MRVVDLSEVFSGIAAVFDMAMSFLKTTYLKLGTHQISLFALAAVLLILSVLLGAILPWFSGGDDTNDD